MKYTIFIVIDPEGSAGLAFSGRWSRRAGAWPTWGTTWRSTSRGPRSPLFMAGDPVAVAYFESATPDACWLPEPMSPADYVRAYRFEVERSDACLAAAQPDDAPRRWPDGDREDRPADLVEVTSHLLAGPPHAPDTSTSFGG